MKNFQSTAKGLWWRVLVCCVVLASMSLGPARSETLPTLTLRPLVEKVLPTPVLASDVDPSPSTLAPRPRGPPPSPSTSRPNLPPSSTTSTTTPPSTARPSRPLIFSIRFPPRYRPSMPPRTSASTSLPNLRPPWSDYEDERREGGEKVEFVVRNNITTTRVFLGTTATLDCTVKNLVNESVSWMRRVDDMLELLTWDTHTYAMDMRYSLERQEGAGWARYGLVIQDVQVADQGQYRCHVATQPPIVLAHSLNVTEPRVQLVDERGTKVQEKHYNSGSMIELRCEVERVPFPPLPVAWRRDHTRLAFNTSRGGISVRRDPASGWVRSRLYVADASPADSGRYSCWYGNYTAHPVTVHVIAGENSAAMQHDSLPSSTSSTSTSTAAATTTHLYSLVLAVVLTLYGLHGPLVQALGVIWKSSSKSLSHSPSPTAITPSFPSLSPTPPPFPIHCSIPYPFPPSSLDPYIPSMFPQVRQGAR